MSNIDNQDNTSEENMTALTKITVIAEELSSFLSSHRRKHKGLMSSCLEYINRIAETAIESDYLGLYEFCALYQERLITIEKSEAKISKDVRDALEVWPNIIANLSNRWVLAAEVYLNNPDKLILVNYEDFLKHKENYIENLASTLRLKTKRNISNIVDIQYQPKGDSTIKWLDFFGEENLYLIERVCLKTMLKFGYDSTVLVKS